MLKSAADPSSAKWTELPTESTAMTTTLTFEDLVSFSFSLFLLLTLPYRTLNIT